MVGRNTGHFTLEAVAREVGISKGGLLHCYPSKEALMSAIIQNVLEQLDHTIQNHLNEKQPEDWFTAYVDTSFEDQNIDLNGLTLLNAVAINPDLLEPVRERDRMWQKQIDLNETVPTRATLVRFVLDVIVMANIFSFAPPNQAMRKKLRLEIKRLLE